MAKIDHLPTIKIKQSPDGWERGYVSECGRWAFDRAPAEPGARNTRVWYLADAQSRLPAICRGPHPSLNEALRVAGGQEAMERLGLTEAHLLAADSESHSAGVGKLPVPAVTSRRRRKAGDPIGPKVATSRCYRCKLSVPRHELVHQRLIRRGYGGRQRSGPVLMCASCAAEQQSESWIAAIIFGVVVGLFLLLCVALGIPLGKAH